ncbi:hypothetical protein [Thioalkalivibrio sulfidiphilus]|uniref:PDC sensor domain-containing protein n=1 Tax=Thioalkalivibrio sulfidiphilus TaxID=1033854 RepID=UPI0003649E3C|nr:hypothetical protein [Thioalkalivibrio sulfidiphilus]
MGTASFLSTLERYHEHREAIRDLLASIIQGVASAALVTDAEARHKVIRCLGERYPFVELLYALDPDGIQVGENLGRGRCANLLGEGQGVDRSQRPYYRLAVNSGGAAIVTDPYLSSASRDLCLSATMACRDREGRIIGYVVLDAGLSTLIEFIMGDRVRRRFQPLFRGVYSLIVIGLLLVVGVLLFTAFAELSSLLGSDGRTTERHLLPFGVIIFLTLALAVFDLGKTVLEEEVLLHKDIFRHSSTRRTITRFIAAILIAVSIEALLLMFKSALSDTDLMLEAVWMMFAAVGLLIGLGIYVYLGARAESILLSHRRGWPGKEGEQHRSQ